MSAGHVERKLDAFYKLWTRSFAYFTNHSTRLVCLSVSSRYRPTEMRKDWSFGDLVIVPNVFNLPDRSRSPTLRQGSTARVLSTRNSRVPTEACKVVFLVDALLSLLVIAGKSWQKLVRDSVLPREGCSHRFQLARGYTDADGRRRLMSPLNPKNPPRCPNTPNSYEFIFCSRLH